MGKTLRKFESGEDYDTIAQWYYDRGAMAPPEDILPTHGLIIDGIAAGFLIATDANLAFLDFYVTDPKSTKAERDLAIDLITRGLLELGEELGFTNFKADTQVRSIVERAKKFGFKEIGTFTNLFLSTDTGVH